MDTIRPICVFPQFIDLNIVNVLTLLTLMHAFGHLDF